MQRVRGWSVVACLTLAGCAMSVAPPATQSDVKESAATAVPGVVLPDTEALRVHDPVGVITRYGWHCRPTMPRTLKSTIRCCT